MSRKQDKIKSLLHELSANYINRESNRQSLITVTNTSLSADRKRATIYVSILPENAEEKAMDFLKRKENELTRHIMKNSNLRIIPQIEFEIDKGEKARQRIEELSS